MFVLYLIKSWGQIDKHHLKNRKRTFNGQLGTFVLKLQEDI